MNLADELRKLTELHQAGHLTDQEFADAKRRLIAEPGAEPPPIPKEKQTVPSRVAPPTSGQGRAIGCGLLLLFVVFIAARCNRSSSRSSSSASQSNTPVATATSTPSTASATPVVTPPATSGDDSWNKLKKELEDRKRQGNPEKPDQTPELKATPEPTPEPRATPTQLLNIGEVGELRSDATNAWRPVYVCKTKEVFDQWMKASAADDTEGTMILLRSGQMFPVKQGTKARKIGIQKTGGFFLGSYLDEVRILEGAYKGWSGVVDPDYVRPVQSAKPQSESEGAQSPEEKPDDQATEEAQYLSELTKIIASNKETAKKIARAKSTPAKQAQLLIGRAKELEKDGEMTADQYLDATKVWLKRGAEPGGAVKLMPVFADTFVGINDEQISTSIDKAKGKGVEAILSQGAIAAMDDTFSIENLPKLIADAITGKQAAQKKLRLGDMTKFKTNQQRFTQVVEVLGKRYKGADRKAKAEGEEPKP
jgi:hypothetical protein